MRITLTSKQTSAIRLLEDKTTRQLLFGGGAGSAKSFLGCYWLIRQCINYPGTRWLMGRHELKNLRRTTLATFFDVAKLLELTNKRHFIVNNHLNIIKFINGSEITLMDLAYAPSDPNFDRLGSLELSGAFIDEVAEIKHKAFEIVCSRIRYRLDEYGLTPKALATCNPSKDWIFREFFLPWESKSLPSHRRFVQATVKDNPYISREYYNNLMLLNEFDKQRLLYGNWHYDDDPARLIDYDKIVDVFTNDYAERGRNYLSIDIALHGSDKFVCAVWCGWRVLEVVEIAKGEADEIESAIKEIANKHKVQRSNIIYDSDGLGSYLRGYLRGAVPFNNGAKPYERGPKFDKENYANLKTQCYFEFSKKVSDGEIFIGSCTDEQKQAICEEMGQIKRDKLDTDGKLFLMPKKKVKEAIGRSPDYTDALMMRMYFMFRDDERDNRICALPSSHEPATIDHYAGEFFGDVAEGY